MACGSEQLCGGSDLLALLIGADGQHLITATGAAWTENIRKLNKIMRRYPENWGFLHVKDNFPPNPPFNANCRRAFYIHLTGPSRGSGLLPSVKHIYKCFVHLLSLLLPNG